MFALGGCLNLCFLLWIVVLWGWCLGGQLAVWFGWLIVAVFIVALCFVV